VGSVELRGHLYNALVFRCCQRRQNCWGNGSACSHNVEPRGRKYVFPCSN